MDDTAVRVLKPRPLQKARLEFALGEVLLILLKSFPHGEMNEANYLRKVDELYRLADEIARENGWEQCYWDPLTFRFWTVLLPKQTANVSAPQYVN